jgi:general secretion pathway protein A
MYNQFYGLSEKPFELTPNPRFLFLTPSHREALDSINDGIKEQRGLISITGEVGTGKTTLVHSLLNRLDEKVKTVFIFHTTITFKGLLETILQELGLPVMEESKMGLWDQLIQHLNQMTARDESLVVIIDEAQNLSEEVMEELGRVFELNAWISNRIPIVFVGQPEFEDRLNSKSSGQLNQRIGIRRQIRPLTGEESKEYIDHRLKLVGSSISETFTPKAISMIIDYAQGIPRIINVICDNAFLMGYGLSRKRIDVDIIREVIMNRESPALQKTIFTRINTAVKKFCSVPFGLNFFSWRISLVILSFLCLGGLLLLLIHGSLQRRPFKTGTIESIKNFKNNPSPVTPLRQTETESISKDDYHPPSGGLEPVPLEPLHPVSPPSSSLTTKSKEDLFEKVIEVEAGQTVSSLSQKYYRMTNATLVDLILDFNPEVTNAHLIRVNQTIKIPKITEEWMIIQSPDLTYKIHVGTFWAPGFSKPYMDEPALKGKEIEILPRKVSPQETWYRIVIGKFHNKDEVLKVIDLLKKKGLLPLFGGGPQRE